MKLGVRTSCLVLGLATTFTLLLTGCGRSRSDGRPFSGQTLKVLNWSDYIDEELVEEFKKRTGAEVVYDTFSQDAELEGKLLTGESGYDVIFPSDRSMPVLIKKGVLAELDRGRLPNWKHLDAKFLGPRFDKDNRHSLPYFWGTLAVGIRTDHVKEPVQGFEVLFDQRYKGHITMLDDAESVVAAVLLHLKRDMNSTDAADLAQVQATLLAQKPAVQAYTSDSYKEKLIKGEAWVALGWNGDLLQASREESKIRVVVPESGTMIWVDNLAIPKDATETQLAYEFINFLLDPQIAARNADFVKYASPNKSARAKISADLLNDPAVYPPQKLLDRCHWLQDRGADIKKIEAVWKAVQN